MLISIQIIFLGFVDDSHANDLQKRESTTGIVFTFIGGVIFYKSKTQLITTGSSTKAEFIVAQFTTKLGRYFWMVLKYLDLIKII